MTRVIKFRAWHFGLKRMFSAEEMTVDQMALLPDGHFANIHSANTKLSEIFSHEEMLPLQFIGFHDKNGKEIYEGDILLWQEDDCGELAEEISLVIFERGSFVRKVKDYAVDTFHDLDTSNNETVIGNVYENPELIPHEQQ